MESYLMEASEHHLYEDIIEFQNFDFHDQRDSFLEIDQVIDKTSNSSMQFGPRKNVNIDKLNEKAASRLERRREQNRKAAAKLRLKKHQKYERLIKNAQIEEDMFIQLQTEVKQLSKAFSETARLLLIHQKQCPFMKVSSREDPYYYY